MEPEWGLPYAAKLLSAMGEPSWLRVCREKVRHSSSVCQQNKIGLENINI